MAEKPKTDQTKILFYTIGIFAVLLIAMYFWKEISVDRARSKMAERQAAAVVEHEARVGELERAATARAEEMLSMMALPLGWAVRNEVMAKDFDRIEEYVVRLVKEPAIKRVVLAGPDGTIQVTTDKKLQDEPASRFFGNLTNSAKIVLRMDETGDYQMMIPINGYNSRLASLVVTVDGDPALGTAR